MGGQGRQFKTSLKLMIDKKVENQVENEE